MTPDYKPSHVELIEPPQRVDEGTGVIAFLVGVFCGFGLGLVAALAIFAR